MMTEYRFSEEKMDLYTSRVELKAAIISYSRRDGDMPAIIKTGCLSLVEEEIKRLLQEAKVKVEEV